MSRCTLRRCVQIWACSDSRRHTYADASPAKQTSHYKSGQCCRRAIEMQNCCKNGKKNLFSIMLPVRGGETARTNRYQRALSVKPPRRQRRLLGLTICVVQLRLTAEDCADVLPLGATLQSHADEH